ncbi:hypothetical protein AAZX31_13G328300 [Glycine max]|nr:hypothetical protein GLYMA_13G346951v4 [Glycine max]
MFFHNNATRARHLVFNSKNTMHLQLNPLNNLILKLVRHNPVKFLSSIVLLIQYLLELGERVWDVLSGHLWGVRISLSLLYYWITDKYFGNCSSSNSSYAIGWLGRTHICEFKAGPCYSEAKTVSSKTRST